VQRKIFFYDLWNKLHSGGSQPTIEEIKALLASLDASCCGENDCGCSPTPPSPPPKPETNPSPIILDLDGDGVKTVDLTNGAYFDHDGNRFAEKSGWVGPNDAILVRDLNNNGQIDDGGEIFGDNTLLANGQKATNGFEALAELDANGDGLVDQNDAGFSTLKLWRDANGNGTVEAGELLTLAEAGVASLDVAYANRIIPTKMGTNTGRAVPSPAKTALRAKWRMSGSKAIRRTADIWTKLR
jgi:hypothetical protein